MKKILSIFSLLLITCLAFQDLSAQRYYNERPSVNEFGYRTVITTRPISLLTLQPNMKAEYGFSDQFSGGLHISYFTGMHSGPKFDPFIRIYPISDHQSPGGFYIQLKASIGSHDKMLDDVEFISDLREDLVEEYENSDLSGTEADALVDELLANEQGKSRFLALGGGVTSGYQWLIGKNQRFVIDLYGGFKRYKSTDFDLSLFGAESTWFNLTRNFPLEVGFQIGVAF